MAKLYNICLFTFSTILALASSQQQQCSYLQLSGYPACDATSYPEPPKHAYIVPNQQMAINVDLGPGAVIGPNCQYPCSAQVTACDDGLPPLITQSGLLPSTKIDVHRNCPCPGTASITVQYRCNNHS